MSELTFVSIRIGDWLRNRATVRHILWSKWLRFGECHYTLSLHNWSMLILPWINVWAGLCVYSYRRATKEPSYCESILWNKWMRLGEFHCTLLLQNWGILILPSINVWADLCFYSHRRSTKEPRYCETYKWLRLGEFHCTLSLHIWSIILPYINVGADLCIGNRQRNRATVTRILWSKWLRLGEFHYTLSLCNLMLIQCLLTFVSIYCYRKRTMILWDIL